MGKPGRLPLLVREPAIADRIVEAVAGGCALKVAAATVKVDERVLIRWMARGRAALAALDITEEDGVPDPDDVDMVDRPYARLCAAVEAARAKAETTAVALLWDIARGGQVLETRTTTRRDGSTEEVVRLAPPDAGPLKFLLERARSERWARTTQRTVVLTGPDGGPVEVTASDNRVADAVTAYLVAREPAG